MVLFPLLALLLLSVIMGFSLYAYRTAFYSSPRMRGKLLELPKDENYDSSRSAKLYREMEAVPFEEVSITSHDGLSLFGRYYHVADGAPLQIQFHGYRGSGIRDFCGGNKLARESGQNTLVVDQRAHGKSEGDMITFGILERYDCLAWANYATKRFGSETPIFLTGISMGAATVLMASDLPLPKNVVGIIADCPYSSPTAIIRKVCGEMGFPPVLAMPFVKLGAYLFGGLRFGNCCAEDSVARSDLPILLIHGEKDNFVPCEMSQKIHAACKGRHEIHTFQDAEHGLSYLQDTPRYEKVVRAFVNSCLEEFQS